MLNLLGLFIIIIMVIVILLPFNDNFWNYINKNKKRTNKTLIDYSDFELDLNSIINDYQSGVLNDKEFDEQVKSFQEIINKSSIDKNARLRIEKLLKEVNSNK